MKDRVSGKPGQYKAVITADELEKLQAGEQFVITLTRDDQATVIGTPYSKASVLPDSLAAVICPDITDPTLADALGSLLPLNGGKSMAANLKMGGFLIKNLADPEEDADAVHKRYVDRQVYHENYLDNSDFSNPVNQRGETSYSTANKFTIDRWKNYSASGLTAEISDGCLALTNTASPNRYLTQTVYKDLSGKYLWLIACLEDGTVYAVMGLVPADDVTSAYSITSGVRGDGLVLALRKNTDQRVEARLGLQGSKSVRLKWAMLYEGEKLLGTESVSGDFSSRVPDYRPKGYLTELMECMRYYQIRSANDVAAVDLRPPMFGTPEVSSVTGGYAYSAEI